VKEAKDWSAFLQEERHLEYRKPSCIINVRADVFVIYSARR